MQSLMNFSNIDIEEELVMFLCSVLAFLILIYCRDQKAQTGGKISKPYKGFAVSDHTPQDIAGAREEKCDVKVEKALRTAFGNEDYWQVLKCWRQLKHSNQSSIHLSMIIRSMRFCNKGAYFIATELKDFFQAHPQECKIGVINDLIEPLGRRADDAQLVELLVRMIPSIDLEKDARTYEIMLTMRAANGNVSKMQEVMAEMNANKVEFTPRATVAVMTMGLQTGNAAVVLKAFTKLKPLWDERETWPVSMFALGRHKINVLMQVVMLACQKLKVSELSLALEGMTLPEEVLGALECRLSSVSDDELAEFVEAIQQSGRSLKTDPVYNTLIGCASSRSVMKSLPPWKAGKREQANSNPSKVKNSATADSDASTSEGSRSDSEEECTFRPCVRTRPGLAESPCF